MNVSARWPLERRVLKDDGVVKAIPQDRALQSVHTLTLSLWPIAG